jgi:hypothetical protein
MKLNQASVSKLELENKVRATRYEPKPSGGPSNIDGHDINKYKQRLFDWLVTAAGETGTLYNWCLSKSLSKCVSSEKTKAPQSNQAETKKKSALIF